MRGWVHKDNVKKYTLELLTWANSHVYVLYWYILCEIEMWGLKRVNIYLWHYISPLWASPPVGNIGIPLSLHVWVQHYMCLDIFGKYLHNARKAHCVPVCLYRLKQHENHAFDLLCLCSLYVLHSFIFHILNLLHYTFLLYFTLYDIFFCFPLNQLQSSTADLMAACQYSLPSERSCQQRCCLRTMAGYLAKQQ